MTPVRAFARIHFEGIFTLEDGKIAVPDVLGAADRNAEH